MSARGWAGRLDFAARNLAVLCTQRRPDGEPCDSCALLIADLRELAALLDRITPEMVKQVELASTKMFSLERRAVIVEAADILTALHRGPAEQQETGR